MDNPAPYDPRVDLAIERTELALERTHLAWMRTIVTMAGAGYGIDSIISALEASNPHPNLHLQQNAHIAGLVFAGSGVVLCVVTTLHYLRRRKQLALQRNLTKISRPPGLLLSIIIFLIALMMLALLIW